MFIKMDTIKLPSFAYFSGSSVLRAIESQPQWEANDVDIYVDISHNEFNPLVLYNLMNGIVNIGYTNIWSTYGYSDIATHEFDTHLCIMKVLFESIEQRLIMELEYTPRGILRVVKFEREDGSESIDVIIIDEYVGDFIDRSFDLDICKNYIDSEGVITCLHKEAIESRYTIMDLNVFIHNMKKINCRKYIERLMKYVKRKYVIHLMVNDETVNIGKDYLNMMRSNSNQPFDTMQTLRKELMLYEMIKIMYHPDVVYDDKDRLKELTE